MKNYVEDIDFCVETLKKGGVILYPTDTIWGIGCDATNDNAVRRIFEIKKRHESKSLIILASNLEMISNYVEKIPLSATKLIKNTEKPLTIIYEQAKNLAKSTIAADGTVAIRIPKDNFCLDLIRNFGKPLVSTSANFSGDDPPANFLEINKNLIKKVDYVVKYRQDDLTKSSPSTIVKLNGEQIIFLRKSDND